MADKYKKKLYKDYKQSVFSQRNLTPQYKPSGKVVATQFGVKRPLNEQINQKHDSAYNFQSSGIKQQRHSSADTTLEHLIQKNDEITQKFAERAIAIHSGSMGGASTEWKKKESKSTLKNRGIPDVKQQKTMGSLKMPKLKSLSPLGLASYIMSPKPAGANSTRKGNQGEYKRVK